MLNINKERVLFVIFKWYVLSRNLMLKNRARPRNNLLTQLIIFNEDVISACDPGTNVLWFNFIFGLNFISLCFGVW